MAGFGDKGVAALRQLLASSFAGRPGLVVGLVIAQLAAAAGTLAQPALQGSIINNGVLAGDGAYINRIAIIMLVIAVAALAAGIGVAYFGSALTTNTAAELRERIYRRVMFLSRNDFDSFGTATLISRSTSDVLAVTSAQFAIVTVAASAPLLTIGAVIGAFGQAPALSPLIVVIAVLLAISVGFVVARMMPLANRSQRALDKVNGTVRSQVAGIRVIRAFGRERHEIDRFEELNDEVTSLNRSLATLQIAILPIVLLIVNATTVVAMLAGAALVDRGSIQIGRLTAFTGYLTQVAVGVSLLVAVTAVVPRAIVSAGRISQVLDAPSDDPGELYALSRGGAVTLELLSAGYRYPGAPHDAVRGVDLVCSPGTLTGIVGGTASGKSTLLALIPRLIEATSGELRACGVDLRYWEPAALRAVIGYVGHGQALLSGDVAHNLRLGRPDATDAELWEALEIARAADFIRARDGALHAEVRQGGGNFSGGQRQRLAIARALVGRPGMLCFDDAFSALDRGTAESILAGIRRHLPACTVIATAQQPQLFASADMIVMLDGGIVVAAGSDRELRSESAEYRDLCRLSLSA